MSNGSIVVSTEENKLNGESSVVTASKLLRRLRRNGIGRDREIWTIRESCKIAIHNGICVCDATSFKRDKTESILIWAAESNTGNICKRNRDVITESYKSTAQYDIPLKVIGVFGSQTSAGKVELQT